MPRLNEVVELRNSGLVEKLTPGRQQINDDRVDIVLVLRGDGLGGPACSSGRATS